MKFTEKAFWSKYDGLWVGAIYAVIVWAVSLTSDTGMSSELILRMVLGFVLGVIMKPVLDGAWIRFTSDPRPKYARAFYGWAMGAPWAAAMILAFWQLTWLENLIWIVGAAVFGAVMANVAKTVPVADARRALYVVKPTGGSGLYPRSSLIDVAAVQVLAIVAIMLSFAYTQSEVPYTWLAIMVMLISLPIPYQFANRGMRALNIAAYSVLLAAGFFARGL